MVEEGFGLVDKEAQRRQDNHPGGASHNRDGVEKEQALVAEEGCEEDDEEQEIFDAAPFLCRGFKPRRGASQWLAGGTAFARREPFQYRTEGAEPTAPHTPKDEGQYHREGCEPQPGNQRSPGKRCRERDEWVEAVEEIRPCALWVEKGGVDEEKEKECKRQNLGNLTKTTHGLWFHSLHRKLFYRQRSQVE